MSNVDTSPEALAALDLKLIARLVHHRDLDIEDARDVIAALKAKIDQLQLQNSHLMETAKRSKILRTSANRETHIQNHVIADLEAERDAALTLLPYVKEYIEQCEVRIDGEWGDCREIDELIAAGDMPKLYWRVLDALAEVKS